MLAPEEIDKLKLTLQSSGWLDVMRPRLAERGQRAVKALVLSPAERTAQFKGTDFDTDDNVLRAIIRDCEWMLMVWSNEIVVANHNRMRDELDMQQSPGTANP